MAVPLLYSYLASLPTTVESSLLWPRAQRDALLAGTSHLADVRELRAAALTEYRRVRRRIAQFEPAWLSDLGLDARSGPCPLSGEASSGSERWLLATGLVRSRAYLVSGGDEAGEEEADDDADADDDEDEDEDDDDDEDEDDDELVLSPLIDLANHDDRLQQSAVVWGRGGAEPADARHHLTLVCGMPVAEGEPLPSTYASTALSTALAHRSHPPLLATWQVRGAHAGVQPAHLWFRHHRPASERLPPAGSRPRRSLRRGEACGPAERLRGARVVLRASWTRHVRRAQLGGPTQPGTPPAPSSSVPPAGRGVQATVWLASHAGPPRLWRRARGERRRD